MLTRTFPRPETGRTNRYWPWFGLAALVLGYAATWSTQFLVADSASKAGGEALMSAIDSGNHELIYRLSAGVGLIAAACLIAFGTGLRRYLSERDDGASLIPEIVFGAILVASGALVIGMSFRAQVFDTLNYYKADPSTHVTLFRLSQDTALSAWAILGAATAAFAAGGIRGRMFSRKFGWFSAVMTLLIVVLCLVGAPFPANFPAGIWLLVTSVWAIRQQRRQHGMVEPEARPTSAAAVFS